jgi:hypothetical protein
MWLHVEKQAWYASCREPFQNFWVRSLDISQNGLVTRVPFVGWNKACKRFFIDVCRSN